MKRKIGYLLLGALIASLLFAPAIASAQAKISALPALTSAPDSNDVMPIVNSGATKKIQVKTLLGDCCINYWKYDTILGSDSNVLFNDYNKYTGTVFIKGTSNESINGGVEINGTSANQLGVKITGYAIDTSQFDIMFNPLGGSIRIDNLPNETNLNALFMSRNPLTNKIHWQEFIISDTSTLDFPAISAHGHQDLTITVTGAELSDVVSLGIPNSSITAEVLFTAYVSATNTVTVRAQNVNGGSPNPEPGIFKVAIIKY